MINKPLASLDEWEDDLLSRYPEPNQPAGSERFRNYAAEARPSVKEFYRLNHQYQTLDFVRQKREQYLSLDKREMGIWEAMEYLNTLIDDSDPDIDLPQIEHLLQTGEAIRAAGRPRWYILAGLIHDLGKILCLWDEPQWAVVGDTFPLAVVTPTRSFTAKRSRPTLTRKMRSCKPSMASTRPSAAWTMC